MLLSSVYWKTTQITMNKMYSNTFITAMIALLVDEDCLEDVEDESATALTSKNGEFFFTYY